jgi:hypothetical protein
MKIALQGAKSAARLSAATGLRGFTQSHQKCMGPLKTFFLRPRARPESIKSMENYRAARRSRRLDTTLGVNSRKAL